MVLLKVPEILSEEILRKMKAPPRSEVPDISPKELVEADGFLFGFPARYGMMSAQFKVFFDATGSLWNKQALAGKPAGFFFSTASQGSGQEETALVTLHSHFSIKNKHLFLYRFFNCELN